ncbi:hypothetical protein E4U42_004412 [Claviceps africana]|uniref:DUF7702 domain-containing protein n=1 Tax=Claviceps africana TaxID=83212 RepID=A0A8K0J7H8_9HYPO|nr:hypothetical protein E4U42_004412 [Claviceps africana]
MPQLGAYDIISIVGIPIYVGFLACAIWLCVKHGFFNSEGWHFIIIIAISRLISFGLRLALLSDPANMSIWLGWVVINSLGLGPLILLLLSLVMHVFECINRQGHVVLRPLYQRVIKLLVLVAIILSIVGGTNSSYGIEGGVISIKFNALTHVGTGLLIGATVILCGEAGLALRCHMQGFAAQREHRIILGVLASLPFVILRLVYSCLTVLAHINSSVWLYLCLAILTEVAVVLMLEVLGLMLEKIPRRTKGQNDPEMLTFEQSKQ